MNYLYPQITTRANKIFEWFATDSPESYKEITDFGLNLYRPGDIKYQFNSDGYRCDEFSLESDIPILFSGCSYTEGVGVHQTETWAYRLLEKIRNKTGKNIPYWNIGITASGVDGQAHNLYCVDKQIDIKYIFALYPPFHRRDYRFQTHETRRWCGVDHGLKFNKASDKDLNVLFCDEPFADHQTFRSLMLIDSIRAKNNATMYCTHWAGDTDVDDIMYNFPDLNYFPWNTISVDIARDNQHPGPIYHAQLADKFWSIVEHHF